MWLALLVAWLQVVAPARLDRGRFTVVYYPGDERLATTLADLAVRNDTFPGLPRPQARALIAIAPDKAHFRQWVGPTAPDWGAAVAFPESGRIVMQGKNASSDAGDPREVLRHELAHLALHEYLGEGIPAWFDEGYATYAAHEWERQDVLAANVALVLHGVPTFTDLDRDLVGGASRAQNAYALANRAVTDLASIDRARGLTVFFQDWRSSQSLELAMRAAYGMSLDGFQHDWQQRTRRTYGGLALVANVSAAGIIIAFLLVPLYLARRRRDRLRYAALVLADEAAERAEPWDGVSAIDQLLARGDGARESTEAGGPEDDAT